jgi:hypothetical protein
MFCIKSKPQTKEVMKTLRLKSLIVGLAFCAGTLTSAQLPKSWFPGGSHPKEYEMTLDRDISHSGKASGTLKSIVPQASGFGTLMQQCKADKYRGKRVRMSGFVRAADVVDWAGLWFRVDGANGEVLSFDNMMNRSIKGTVDWKLCEVVLDVPKGSEQLAFGVLLIGAGHVWVDDLKFEVVGKDVPTTNMEGAANSDKTPPKPANKPTTKPVIPDKPVNLDFEG